jgi:transcriptional regulator of acetoin/glycerol metabolism
VGVNVRQLQNVLLRAVVRSSTAMLRREDLPREVFEPRMENPRNYRESAYQTRRQSVRERIGPENLTYNEIAALLRMHPKSVHRSLKRLNLSLLLK